MGSAVACVVLRFPYTTKAGMNEQKPFGSDGLSSTLNYEKSRLTAPPPPDLSSPFCIKNLLIFLIPGLLGRPALLPRDIGGGEDLASSFQRPQNMETEAY